MKEVLPILRNAQTRLADLEDEVEDRELPDEDLQALWDVKSGLAQAIAILETAAAQGVF